MKRGVNFFLLGVVFVFTALVSQADAEEKFAHVDLSRIFSEYRKTQEYDKVLNSKQDVYEKERDEKVKDVRQFQDKMNLLSDAQKEAKKKDLEGKVKLLQDFDRGKQTDLRKEQDEKMKEILQDIQEVVKDYAQKQNYTLVFNDRVLVYQNKNLDITDKIIQMLNKNYKQKP